MKCCECGRDLPEDVFSCYLYKGMPVCIPCEEQYYHLSDDTSELVRDRRLAMLKVNGVDVSHCKGFAYDGCHKIYLIESDSQIGHAFEVADAICRTFNSVMRKSKDDDGSWYVYSEPNFWAEDGDEVESVEDAEVVQCCIFQYYK